MRLSVKITGHEQQVGRLKLFNAQAIEGVQRAVRRAAIDTQREARKRAPVDTGRLRSSIRPEFGALSLSATVGTHIHYAPYVEFGTRPHWAPIGALGGWSRRHGIGAGAVQRSIAIWGTPAKPFLFPAWVYVRPSFKRNIEKALHDAKRRAS